MDRIEGPPAATVMFECTNIRIRQTSHQSADHDRFHLAFLCPF